jgi:crossover junction endodeoxyribonuclease RusA
VNEPLPKLAEFRLPYPPSVNHYWKHFRGRAIVGMAGRKYHRDVSELLGQRKAIDSRLSVVLYCWMPDKRIRDLDNVAKCAIDSLTKCGFWVDDNQIDRLLLERCGVCSPGWIDVEVYEMAKAKPTKKAKR